MQKYFREALTAYKQFRKTQNELNEGFETAANSGHFNRSYLNELRDTNTERIDQMRKTTEARFSTIREDLERTISARNELSGTSISESLLNLLNSPISLTPADYTRLAKVYTTPTNSRMLHDHAQSHGYVLENYISVEDSMKQFDTLTNRLKKSMWTNKGEIPFYSDLQSAEEDGGRLCSNAMTKTYDCYKQPTTLEEAVVHDLQTAAKNADNVPKEYEQAFLKGFTGIESAESKDEDILSESEKLDAQIHSLIHGNGGEITPEDVVFVRSDANYLKIRQENPISSKDIPYIQNAISYAQAAKQDAIDGGRSVQEANEAALKAYQAGLSATKTTVEVAAR